jgi:Double-stranded DNA-binding domain.
MRRELLKRYKQAQQEQQIRTYMQRALDAKAYERLMNIKVSNRELYMQLVQLLINITQSGKTGKITESQLISLIGRVSPNNESKIEFRHK